MCLDFVRGWSWWTDSNPRPADYKSAALPTELHQRLMLDYYTILFSVCQVLFQTFLKKCGRGDRTRTCGILVPNQALYQTELRLGLTIPVVLVGQLLYYTRIKFHCQAQNCIFVVLYISRYSSHRFMYIISKKKRGSFRSPVTAIISP